MDSLVNISLMNTKRIISLKFSLYKPHLLKFPSFSPLLLEDSELIYIELSTTTNVHCFKKISLYQYGVYNPKNETTLQWPRNHENQEGNSGAWGLQVLLLVHQLLQSSWNLR